MKRVLGALMLLTGAGLAVWIALARLSGESKDNDPLSGVGLCVGLFVVGLMWIRSTPSRSSGPRVGEKRDTAEEPRPSAFNPNLNLSAMTVAGWGLLTCVFAAVIAGAVLLAFTMPDAEKWANDRLASTLIGIAGVAVAIGFYQIGKLILRWVGLPVYRWEEEERKRR